MKSTSADIPAGKSKPAGSLIWFDWAVLFSLVIVVVAVSPWGIVANAIICGLILVIYRVALRKVLIRLAPALYRV